MGIFSKDSLQGFTHPLENSTMDHFAKSSRLLKMSAGSYRTRVDILHRFMHNSTGIARLTKKVMGMTVRDRKSPIAVKFP